MDLDLFVMFSSTSGVIGMPALGVYTAFNAFLHTLAHLRGLAAASIAYGTWQGDGMAATHTGGTRAHLSQFGQFGLAVDARRWLGPCTTSSGKRSSSDRECLA
jgi:hypothetical protein